MNQRTLLKLAALGSALLLFGAGCPTAQKASPPAIPTPLSEAAAALKPGFIVQAKAADPGAVKVTWTAPADADPESVFRILHSRNPEPSFPGAYWFQRSNPSAREAVLTNLKAGQRFIRVCEFKNDQCARYSNEVELDVQ